MSKIVTFSNAAFNIECIVVDDMPWFKGREVATILNYANTKQAIINNVSNDDKKKHWRSWGVYLTDPCLTTTKTQSTLTSQVSTAS